MKKAIGERYGLQPWSAEDDLLHKRADHLAAASEALHLAGWTREEILNTLGIRLCPVILDPLPLLPGKLQQWLRGDCLEAPADLTAAFGREGARFC